jgi:uncharacterized protein YuzE
VADGLGGGRLGNDIVLLYLKMTTTICGCEIWRATHLPIHLLELHEPR